MYLCNPLNRNSTIFEIQFFLFNLLVDFPALILRASNPDIFSEFFSQIQRIRLSRRIRKKDNGVRGLRVRSDLFMVVS